MHPLTPGRTARPLAAGLAAAALVAGGLAMVPTASATSAATSSALSPSAAGDLAPARQRLTAATFADPAESNRPKMRWWLPVGPMDEATVRAEVADIAAAGFSGVEILGTPTGDKAALAEYGFGTPAWNATMAIALDEADQQGITVDFTASASYPAAVPQDPDAPAAAKELVLGRSYVAGGGSVDGALPGPELAARNGVEEESLVAVTAARLAEGSTPDSKPVRLDESTAVDLTGRVEDGALSWTAPDGGQWVVIAWWQRSDGDTVDDVTDPTSYTVDHLSRAGAEALTDYWDDTLITPAVREQLAATGGDLFEDSLHLDPEILWTPAFLAEFEERRGYDLTTYLPAITILGLNRFFNFPASIETTPAFDFTGRTGERVRNDYYQTLTDLYVENHLEPIKAWANEQGLQLRVQPSYGQSLEITAPALAVDVPETESFQLGNMIDGFRSQGAAVHMGRKPVYSTECCASFGAAHAFTWEDTLSHVHKNFSGGVNQVVFHGYPHQDGPGATWPGWYHFGNAGFSENYGAQPTWTQVQEVTDYLARQQLVLRQGKPQVDVAIYRHSYWDYGKPGRSLAGKPKYYNNDNLERAGYTYEFMSPTLLELPNANVRNGRLDPGGSAYRALVIDKQGDMPVGTARTILALAKKGLRVVVVGAAPSRTPFHGRAARNDAIVRATMDRLLDLPNVVQVRSDDAIPGALDRAGVRQAADYASGSPILNVHRAAANTDYYWFYNPSTARSSTQVSLEGKGRPYVLDGWSGGIEAIGHYRSTARRVATELTLAPGETTVIAVTRGKHLGGATGPSVTTAPTDVAYAGDRLVGQVAEPGRYVYRLADGRTRRITVAAVPGVTAPSSWHLQVDDWKPGATPDETVVESHELDLTTLQAWSAIPELQDVSGVGTYTTTFGLPAGWGRSHGAHLSLGAVFDTFRVEVNGRQLPGVDQANPVVDVSRYLRPGENTLEVTVATTLRNRMRTVTGSGQAGSPRQPYGLVGPVVITPYVERTIKR